MVLAVRTLVYRRTSSRWASETFVLDDGRRTLRFRRGKTDVGVEVEIVGELARIGARSCDGSLHPAFVARDAANRTA